MNNTIIGSVNQVYKKLDGKVINLITKDNEPVDLDIHLKGTLRFSMSPFFFRSVYS